MQPIAFWFMLLFVAIGLLFIGLSVPLVRHRVKPNRWYGFRTPKTLSGEHVWYEANEFAGRMGVRAGIVLIVAAIVLYFALQANFIAYAIAWSIVLLTTSVIHLWLSFRHLRSLGGEIAPLTLELGSNLPRHGHCETAGSGL